MTSLLKLPHKLQPLPQAVNSVSEGGFLLREAPFYLYVHEVMRFTL